jgi:hypothetical protein
MIGGISPEDMAARQMPVVKIRDGHLEIARSAWQAYRAPTPQDWFGLLSKDLSALPLFRQAAVAWLEELPGLATGLGDTEIRMLELISEGNASPSDVFPGHEKRNTRRTFDYWQIGALLDGMADAPVPAVMGWMAARSRQRFTRTASVISATCKASCRSRRSVGPFWPGVRISAVTIRSIAGGVELN